MSSPVQRIRRFVRLDAAWLTKDRVLAFSRAAFGVGAWAAFIAVLPDAHAWNAVGFPASLALLYVAPLAILVASTHGIPLAPPLLAVLAALVLRRAYGERVS